MYTPHNSIHIHASGGFYSWSFAQNMEATVEPNFSSVPILLRFLVILRHGEKLVWGLFSHNVEVLFFPF